ncbi:hypothetical protein [Teredinibacter turnerae]|uniref:hypothetical protein n=1 Tax=Teredinibacter turnerae TaxID=2426 RepID=UPI0003829760|nr:hypothetical protein [Teredinibacter turnerae]
MFGKKLGAILLLGALSACGGSADDSDEPQYSGDASRVFSASSDWKSLLARDPDALSETELKEAYLGLALSEYSGSTELVNLTPELAIKFVYLMRSYSPYADIINVFPENLGEMGVQYYDHSGVSTDLTKNDSINTTVECSGLSDQSNVTYSGSFSGGVGLLKQNFQGCTVPVSKYITGESIAFITPYLEHDYGDTPWYRPFATTFTEGLEVDQIYGPDNEHNHSYQLLGYTGSYPAAVEGYVYETGMVIRRSDDQGYEALKVLREVYGGSSANSDEFNGGLAIKGYGSVLVSTGDVRDVFKGTGASGLILTGRDGVKARFTSMAVGQHVLDMDNDGDGIFDDRVVFSTNYSIASATPDIPILRFEFDSKATPLRPLQQVKLPPTLLHELTWGGHYELGGALVLSPPLYSDLDTSTDDLELEIIWRNNGEVIAEGADMLELPSNLFTDISGITVEVAISDGSTRIVSAPLDTFWLQFDQGFR